MSSGLTDNLQNPTVGGGDGDQIMQDANQAPYANENDPKTNGGDNGGDDMDGGGPTDPKKRSKKNNGFSPMKISKTGQNQDEDESPDQMDVNGDGENAGGGEAGGNQRIDRFGNAIVKTRGKNAAKTVVPDSPSKRKEKEKEEKKLRHKICFIDKFEKDADLIRVHYVLSYKKYNALNTYDPYDAEESSNHSHCCTTF